MWVLLFETDCMHLPISSGSTSSTTSTMGRILRSTSPRTSPHPRRLPLECYLGALLSVSEYGVLWGVWQTQRHHVRFLFLRLPPSTCSPLSSSIGVSPSGRWLSFPSATSRCTTVSHITSLMPFAFPSCSLKRFTSSSSSETRDCKDTPVASGPTAEGFTKCAWSLMSSSPPYELGALVGGYASSAYAWTEPVAKIRTVNDRSINDTSCASLAFASRIRWKDAMGRTGIWSFASLAPPAWRLRLMWPTRSGGRSIELRYVMTMPLCEDIVRRSWCEAMS